MNTQRRIGIRVSILLGIIWIIYVYRKWCLTPFDCKGGEWNIKIKEGKYNFKEFEGRSYNLP